MLSQYLQYECRPSACFVTDFPCSPPHLCYSCNTFLQNDIFRQKERIILWQGKRVERNISLMTCERYIMSAWIWARTAEGKRVKQYRTFPNLTSARTGLRSFTPTGTSPPPAQAGADPAPVAGLLDGEHHPGGDYGVCVSEDHRQPPGPAAGRRPLSKLSPKQIQEYYQTMTRTEGLSSNTIRRHH